jgi:Ubiquitin-2 like Rad60 SUMO-like
MAKSRATTQTSAPANQTAGRRASASSRRAPINRDEDGNEAAVVVVVAAAPATNHSHKKQKVNDANHNGGSNGAEEDARETRGALLRAPPPPPAAAALEDDEGDANRDNNGENADADDNVRGHGGDVADEDNGKDDPYCWIKLPMRPTAFIVPETWWMVDLHARPVPKQGATPLVKRCMRELGWDEAKARNVLRAYRLFLSVKAATKDWNAELLSPSIAVDQMWHQHLLDNAHYAHDCLLLCDGHFVRHNPDGGLDVEARKIRSEATRQALLEHYGEEEEGELDRTATGPWKEVFGGAGDPPPAGPASLSPGPAPAQDQDQASDAAENNNINNGATVTFDVVDPTGRRTTFLTRPTTRMGDVLAAYAQRSGLDASGCRFIFQSRTVGEDATVGSLGLQNGDNIHVWLSLRGC